MAASSGDYRSLLGAGLWLSAFAALVSFIRQADDSYVALRWRSSLVLSPALPGRREVSISNGGSQGMSKPVPQTPARRLKLRSWSNDPFRHKSWFLLSGLPSSPCWHCFNCSSSHLMPSLARAGRRDSEPSVWRLLSFGWSSGAPFKRPTRPTCPMRVRWPTRFAKRNGRRWRLPSLSCR